MDTKNATENAVEFIWHVKITKDFYEASSLRTIYEWLLNIAKSECEAKGQHIVDNKIYASFDFPLEGEQILITVNQKVYLD